MTFVLKTLRSPRDFRRAIKMAFIITPILTLINHWNELVMGDFEPALIATILLTFVVPFSVSIISAAGVKRASSRQSRSGANTRSAAQGDPYAVTRQVLDSLSLPVSLLDGHGSLIMANPPLRDLLREGQASIPFPVESPSPFYYSHIPPGLLTQDNVPPAREGLFEVTIQDRQYELEVSAIHDKDRTCWVQHWCDVTRLNSVCGGHPGPLG